MKKSLFLFVPIIFGTYFYNVNTFISAQLASKSFINFNEKFINKLNDPSYFTQIQNLKSKLTTTIKLQQFKKLLLETLSSIQYPSENQKIKDFIYRLQWMIVHLNSLSAKGKKMKFDQDCKKQFDTEVDPKYLIDRSSEIHQKLRNLLGCKKDQNLYEKLNQFKKKIMIPKNKYQEIFTKLVKQVLSLIQIKQLKDAQLIEQYIDDISMCFQATCQPIKKGVSKMTVNIARPISYDKAQQLAAHQLTHHFQFVLMQNLINKFPEMQIIKDSMSLSMLLEGGAQLAVDLIYDSQTRFRSLKHMLNKKYTDQYVKKILQIQNLTWKSSWSNIISISKRYLDEEIDKTQLIKQLQYKTFKPHNSWPNADFIEQYRAYVQSYGWGRQLIMRYLNQTNCMNLQGYINFMKRPLPPSRMQKIIKQQKYEEI